MAKTKIKSPNIIFTETDKSQVLPTRDVSEFAIVGTTPKGRAFVPTIVTSLKDYIYKFGELTDSNNNLNGYVGVAVQETLQDADSVMVISVMGTEEYSAGKVLDINVQTSGYTGSLAQLFLTTKGISDNVTSCSLSGTIDNFTITVFSGSTQLKVYSNLSLNYSTENSITELFNNPLSNANHFYVKYFINPNDLPLPATGVVVNGVWSTNEIIMPPYSEASTPWIISQEFSGTSYELFKFETLNQGEGVNRDFKVSIENITLASELSDPDAEYGTFDVRIRAYDDTDDSIKTLEFFPNLTLNPNDANFIGNRIGTLKESYNNVSGQIETTGEYPNRSQFVRVILGSYEDFPKIAVPFGFNKYRFGMNVLQATSSLFAQAVSGSLDTTTYAGVKFDSSNYIDYFHTELPKSNSQFVVEQSTPFYITGSSASSSVSELDIEFRKFTVGFFGGTSGISMSTPKKIGENATPSNTFGLDFSTTNSNGYLSYKKAIDILSDKDNILFKTLGLVGLNLVQHGNVITYALDMAKERGDIFVPIDASNPIASSTTAISTISATMDGAFDSSYGCALAPWYRITINGVRRTVPMTALFLRVLANNDNVARPWYSPLGFERGIIQGGGEPYTKFSLAQRDILDDLRVNTVVKFAGEPLPVLLNDRTLQKKESALSSINVRRLLNEAKIQINSIVRKYIGRPLTPQTRTILSNEISEYLSFVRSENGLERFEAIFDETVNTPDVVDQAIIQGVIFLVPIRAVRGISIGFVIGKTGTTYTEQ